MSGTVISNKGAGNSHKGEGAGGDVPPPARSAEALRCSSIYRMNYDKEKFVSCLFYYYF